MPDQQLIHPETPEQVMERYRAMVAERAKTIGKEITSAPTNVIRTKGRVFTMPDGTTNPGPLTAVIVDFVAQNSFFEGAYNANAPKAPVCYAAGELDSLRPSAGAPKPQHQGDCASCPKNQWGTATNGGKGKACKNQMKIAIIAADLATPDVGKLYTLNVSPTGIKIFSGFVRRVQKMLGDEALPMRVVCNIGFDQAQPYPTLTFTETVMNPNLGVALSMMSDAREMLLREPKGDEE